ncbi:MAG: MASE1 domain-containing protein [bacterium]
MKLSHINQKAGVPILFALVVVCYYCLGKLGLMAQNINEISAFWPAIGFGLGIFILAPRVYRYAILLSMILLSWSSETPLLTIFGIAGSQYGAIYLASEIYLKAKGQPKRFGNTADFFRLMFVSSLVGSAVSSVFGVSTLAIAGYLTKDYGFDFMAWFLGDWVGITIVTPLMLAFQKNHHTKLSFAKKVEVYSFIVFGVVVSAFSFQLIPGSIQTGYPLIFIPSALAIWVGVRFGIRGAVISNLILASVAFVSSVLSVGPYASDNGIYVHFWLALFILVSSFTSLYISMAQLEIKNKNGKLNLAEYRLNQALMASNIGIWEWSVETGQVYYDQYWMEKFHAGSRDRPASLDEIKAHIHPDDFPEYVKHLKNYFKGESKTFVVELRARDKHDQWIWVESRGKITKRNEQGEALLMVGSNQDVTNRKEFEKLKNKVIKSQNLESLGLMAGGIAHDFNNLLQGIVGHASLALDDAGDDQGLKEHLNVILQSTDSAAALCQNLLAYSGGGQFLITYVNLNEIVKNMGELLDISIAKKASIVYQLEELIPKIQADASQMQQLVMNLITNAAEACEHLTGEVEISTDYFELQNKMDLTLPHKGQLSVGNYVILRVKDNGKGINDKNKIKIFDPFFTTKTVGRGLGMAAISGIVKGHKAGLILQSEVGVGTQIEVYFKV